MWQLVTLSDTDGVSFSFSHFLVGGGRSRRFLFNVPVCQITKCKTFGGVLTNLNKELTS